jgi:HEAT repeat protein
VFAAIAALSLLVLGMSSARKPVAPHAHESDFDALTSALSSSDEDSQIESVHHLAELGDPHAIPALIKALDSSTSDRVAEHILQVLPEFGDAAAESIPALARFAERTEDPFVKLAAATASLRLEDPRGFSIVANLLADEPPLLVEQEAAELLREMIGDDFGVGKSEDDEERAGARERFSVWLARHATSIRWRPDLRRFD